ncbi:hypothetical protein AgCh_029378 [Apium graveolens]
MNMLKYLCEEINSTYVNTSEFFFALKPSSIRYRAVVVEFDVAGERALGDDKDYTYEDDVTDDEDVDDVGGDGGQEDKRVNNLKFPCQIS